ncbi:hypothetical protein MJO29_010823 [Puccinia striiformis f. sp. tritici]|uniref:hypothetical protein n=1 Tax=Puccinia striiformis f. sp. tritici TaxID=168172 RepID=UPI0020077A91|nr:hypothetical protein Pst134EA_020778 [Puccinia striiformis f. sp. tritici]KAH9456867.1 hypothetical protein Pst134EA_020778 [Puccinia striiformis f. sp. tritici]KAI7946296.1 hypothetical protein MJO29_010823 [Puccinia striiformis f. sp. tritici]
MTILDAAVLTGIVRERGEAGLEDLIEGYKNRSMNTIRAMQELFHRGDLTQLAAEASYLQRWAARLGAMRVHALCTQIMVQSRSNPLNHEQDQIGCKVMLLNRQNARANQSLQQILSSRRR